MAVIAQEGFEKGQTPELPAPPRRFGAAIAGLAFIALAAVVVAAVLLNTGENEATGAVATTGGAVATQAVATPTAPSLQSDQQILANLANLGHIPAAAVDWTLVRTEQLVNQGLIPAQTLQPYVAPVVPLFSEHETLMIELARSGQIPVQAVDWEDVEMKKLVNEGLIPREALNG